MKTQQFSNLIKLAQTLKWLVWAYDVPDYSKVEPGTDHETAKLIAPRKRIYVLKSPYGVPFRDGKPVAPEKEPRDDIGQTTRQYKAPARETELEAWQDLPETEEQLRQYSENP